MPEERDWNWTETAFKKVPVPYPLVSLILFVVSFLIYVFLSKRVESFELDIYTSIVTISTCFLVACEPTGVRYFIDNTRDSFRNMKPAPEHEKKISDLNQRLEEKFTGSKIYYIIIILVIAPFILIDPIRGECYLFSVREATIWSILLDTFGYIITLLILYSMSTIIWIILNISWALAKLESDPYKHSIKIDLYSIDKVGGLRPIRNLILKLVVFQFITISLAIITFIRPKTVIYQEVTFLIILFLFTMMLFFLSRYVIHKLLEDKRECDISIINELYDQQNQRMQSTISCKDYNNKDMKLDHILKSMEFLQDERERLMRASKRAYDFKDMFIFISSFLLPFVTTYILPLIMPKINQ